MTCKEIYELMPDVAAGLYPASVDVGNHLSRCGACATKFHEMKQTMAMLDEWQAPEPSAYFDVRLQARLREEMARPQTGWLQWMRKPALALSLTVLMAVGATFVNYEYRGSHNGSAEGPVFPARPEPGTAVGDLQALEKNHDLYADFDLLDDVQIQQNVTANP
jgi:hypothetical protein